MERFCEKLPSDRRLARRHNLRMPLRLRVRGAIPGEKSLESENISQRGVFFTSDMNLNKGTTVDVLLEMPEEVTGVPTAQWLCTGHVARIVPGETENDAQGFAVQFDFYEVSRYDKPGWPMRVGLRGPVAPPIER